MHQVHQVHQVHSQVHSQVHIYPEQLQLICPFFLSNWCIIGAKMVEPNDIFAVGALYTQALIDDDEDEINIVFILYMSLLLVHLRSLLPNPRSYIVPVTRVPFHYGLIGNPLNMQVRNGFFSAVVSRRRLVLGGMMSRRCEDGGGWRRMEGDGGTAQTTLKPDINTQKKSSMQGKKISTQKSAF